MTDKPWYPVVYMFVVTAVFSGILIRTSRVTQTQVRRNEQLFRQRAVLTALGLAGTDTSRAEIHQMYTARIRPILRDPNRPDREDNVVQYLLTDVDDPTIVVACGVPIVGRGYWDRIAGVVGIAGDGRTVLGIDFYDQKETPGLGAEIAQPAFRDQFENKRLAETDTPIDIRPSAAELNESSVHAVTGATQTSRRLALLMNEDLVAWRSARAAGAGSLEGEPR